MLYEKIVHREVVEKGWSGDKKYCVTLSDGERYLLRISPYERKERRAPEFTRMQQVAALGIRMCLPVEFGICEAGVYSLYTWIDGSDAEKIIPQMPEAVQYQFGLDAGRILKQIHTLPAPENLPGWAERFSTKIDRKIKLYNACPLKYDGGEVFLKFIFSNRHLIADRPQTYQHGDYHIGNMMLDRKGVLTIIDFDRDDYGDPWEEFNRIVWCAQKAPQFASGMVDGYFNGQIPEEFWRLLALYIAVNTISSLPWSHPFRGGRSGRNARSGGSGADVV